MSTRRNQSIHRQRCPFACSFHSGGGGRGGHDGPPRIAVDQWQTRNQDSDSLKQIPTSHPQSAHRTQSSLLKLGTGWNCCPPGFPSHHPSSQNTAASPGQGEETWLSSIPSPQPSRSLRRLFCSSGCWAHPKEKPYRESMQRELTSQLRDRRALL